MGFGSSGGNGKMVRWLRVLTAHAGTWGMCHSRQFTPACNSSTKCSLACACGAHKWIFKGVLDVHGVSYMYAILFYFIAVDM